MRTIYILATACLATAMTATCGAEEPPVDRLDPVYRHSILVSDLDRSLTLYRDALGLELGRVSETSADSYSYVFFDIPPGSMKRFAYLSGEGDANNVLGIGEVPGIDLGLPEKPRSAAFVVTVADIEDVMEKVEALGLELIPPYEFMSREAGKPGIDRRHRLRRPPRHVLRFEARSRRVDNRPAQPDGTASP